MYFMSEYAYDEITYGELSILSTNCTNMNILTSYRLPMTSQHKMPLVRTDNTGWYVETGTVI